MPTRNRNRNVTVTLLNARMQPIVTGPEREVWDASFTDQVENAHPYFVQWPTMPERGVQAYRTWWVD